MLGLASRVLASLGMAAGISPAPGLGDEPAPKPPTLAMTPAVACKTITGLGDYVELAGATLTADDKLLVYYQPQHYRVESVDGRHHVHLAQDSRIRRRDSPAVLQSKDDFLVYEVRRGEPLGPIYLTNSVSMKGLKPGDYDLEIILNDRVAGAKSTSQVLKFSVVKPGVTPP